MELHLLPVPLLMFKERPQTPGGLREMQINERVKLFLSLCRQAVNTYSQTCLCVSVCKKVHVLCVCVCTRGDADPLKGTCAEDPISGEDR